jgi:hypothetical protein
MHEPLTQVCEPGQALPHELQLFLSASVLVRLVVVPNVCRSVRPGDVVLCETWRGLLAHRVVSIKADVEGTPQLVLRGDASLEPDRPGLVRGCVGPRDRR